MSLKNKTFGMIWSEKRIYKKDADYFFTAFNKTKYFNHKSIIHFYLWDTHFKPIETKQGFQNLLNMCKEKGVKYICQSDFSCWFHYKEQRETNIIKNFEYYQMIIDNGFMPVLNFNTIFNDYFYLYEKILLKHHECIVMDFNHSEDKYIENELYVFNRLLKLSTFDNLVFLTSKKNSVIAKKYLNSAL